VWLGSDSVHDTVDDRSTQHRSSQVKSDVSVTEVSILCLASGSYRRNPLARDLSLSYLLSGMTYGLCRRERTEGLAVGSVCLHARMTMQDDTFTTLAAM